MKPPSCPKIHQNPIIKFLRSTCIFGENAVIVSSTENFFFSTKIIENNCNIVLPLAFVLLSLAEREKRSDINIINQHKVALPSFLPSLDLSLSLSLSLCPTTKPHIWCLLSSSLHESFSNWGRLSMDVIIVWFTKKPSFLLLVLFAKIWPFTKNVP